MNISPSSSSAAIDILNYRANIMTYSLLLPPESCFHPVAARCMTSPGELLCQSTFPLRSGITFLDTADATARRRPDMDAAIKRNATSIKQGTFVVISLEALERFPFQNDESWTVECQEGNAAQTKSRDHQKYA
jgi:hypothetical protein